jgi:peptidoglycan/xylan/chitin deacetylase (PgdA/CDA1 family)
MRPMREYANVALLMLDLDAGRNKSFGAVGPTASRSRRKLGIPSARSIGIRQPDRFSVGNDTLATQSKVLDRLFRSSVNRIKSLAGWIIFRSRLHKRLLRGRAVTVVFHRVNDAYPDNPITCSRAQFETFVRFFAEFFEVISLTEQLDRLANGAELGSTLTITFDDGYEGNATMAAPILEQYGLRACFFVSTAFIGTKYIPWWDREQEIPTRWMTCDQVRGLRAAGHEVGSHTATHVNLGEVVGEEARQDIAEGKARLEEELSESSGLFAYPYGGRKHLTPENKLLPRELGLRCNVAAYGGTVSRGDDPFALKRTSITKWFASPYQFGFELVAGRLEQD